ncbi:hypothetical protein [Streptomyces sp. bgisy060]|uniref:hypothetical protein n=1 Tax=Streptomyces sp. bgisy060 TaxID=3413775 RepID=UPI003EBD1DCD
MRLTLRAQGREIDIELGQNGTAALKAAEATALRLLEAMSGEEPPSDVPFGFALDTDTERATPEPVNDEE